MKLSFFFAAAQAALFFPLGAVAGPVPTQTENIENIAPRESMPPTPIISMLPSMSVAAASASASGAAEMQAMMKEIMETINKAGTSLAHMMEGQGGASILGGGQAGGSAGAGASGSVGAGAGAGAGGAAEAGGKGKA